MGQFNSRVSILCGGQSLGEWVSHSSLIRGTRKGKPNRGQARAVTGFLERKSTGPRGFLQVREAVVAVWTVAGLFFYLSTRHLAVFNCTVASLF